MDVSVAGIKSPGMSGPDADDTPSRSPRADEEGFGTPVNGGVDGDRQFPPTRTPHFAATPAFVVTRRGNQEGIATPLTWAAKSEWPQGMMTPNFDADGATPEGSWLSGPVPFFNPGGALSKNDDNVVRVLPWTPAADGRAAAAAAASAKKSPTAGGTPKSRNRLTLVLASPAKGTYARTDSGGTTTKATTPTRTKPKTELGARRSLGSNFGGDENFVEVNMMTPSPSRNSGRLDSPIGSTKKPPLTPGLSPARRSPRQSGVGVLSPAAKMQAHAIVSLANLKSEMEDKERVWGDALAEAEAELAGARRQADEFRVALEEEISTTPEKMKLLQVRQEASFDTETKPTTPPSRVEGSEAAAVASASFSSEPPKPDSAGGASSVFLHAKVSSLEREVAKLLATRTSTERAHQQQIELENKKNQARVDAAKGETAASFAREKDLWAEVHRLREAVTKKGTEESTQKESTEKNGETAKLVDTLRTDLDTLAAENKALTKQLAEMEQMLELSTDDAERFRMESDALGTVLAETTRRLESSQSLYKAESNALVEQEAEHARVFAHTHQVELQEAEQALADARAALVASTSAEAKASAEAERTRVEADARVATERTQARALIEERETLLARLEELTTKMETANVERDKERRDAKQNLQRAETKLADAERRVAVAEVAAESREREQEQAQQALVELSASSEQALVELTASAQKTAMSRSQVAVDKVDLLETELGRVQMSAVTAQNALFAAQANASAATKRAEAAEADAFAARATADTVRAHAATDRSALLRAESRLDAQKADTGFQLAEAARLVADRESAHETSQRRVTAAETSAGEARAELASVRGALVSARAEVSVCVSDLASCAKAKETANAELRESVVGTNALNSELASVKSRCAVLVDSLASSRAAAAAVAGDAAVLNASAVASVNAEMTAQLQTQAVKENVLIAKIRHLEVEVERARASDAAFQLEREETELAMRETHERLDAALRVKRSGSSGSLPGTPPNFGERNSSLPSERKKHGNKRVRQRRNEPATTGKGRTPRRAALTQYSETETESGSDEFDQDEFGDTPGAVAGLVGLATGKRRNLATPSERNFESFQSSPPGGSIRRHETYHNAGTNIDQSEAAARRRQDDGRSRRLTSSFSFALAIAVFALAVSTIRSSVTGTGTVEQCAGGLVGVLVSFIDEWLSGTVRARFRLNCDGVVPS